MPAAPNRTKSKPDVAMMTTTTAVNDKLKQHFDKVMVNATTPLLSNYTTYRESLPVRHAWGDNPCWKLVDLPFFAREVDLQVTVTMLEALSTVARRRVKYVVSPTCTGKTASICPAFLKSASSDENNKTRFSHYLYLAFANNNGNNFVLINPSDVSEVSVIAELQGAAFMIECVTKLFNCDYGWIEVPTSEAISSSPHRTIEDEAKRCLQLMNSKVNPGRILIHVDEHRKISSNHDFRRGALSVLSYLENRMVVVATYVEAPTEVPADGSSGICRFPVPIPALDINAALRSVGCEVDINFRNRKERRAFASLKFRLASYLSRNMIPFHFRFSMGVENSLTDEVNSVIELFRSCVIRDSQRQCFFDVRPLRRLSSEDESSDQSPVSPLENLILKTQLGRAALRVEEIIMQMLVGVSDEFQNDQRMKTGIVAFLDGDETKLTYSIRDLASKIPSREIYGEVAGAYQVARRMFMQCLEGGLDDLLSGLPLERAYLWSIFANAAVSETINVNQVYTVCTFNAIKGSRLFGNSNVFTDTGVDLSDMQVDRMSQNVLYYAIENQDGTTSHPIGDIFFLSSDNRLVVIDVTAKRESSRQMTRKRHHAKAFIAAWKSQYPQMGLTFAIISPLEEGLTRHASDCPELRYIFGKDARSLLGGLSQFMAWYECK